MKHRLTVCAAAMLLPAMLLSACGSEASEADLANSASYAEESSEGAFSADAEDDGEALMEKSDEEVAEDGADLPEAEPTAAMEGLEGAEGGDPAEDATAPTDEPDPDEPGFNEEDALILTAGEWNDNENWGFFSNLVTGERLSFPAYGLDPTGRVAVTAEKDGAPVRNLAVSLTADGTVIWNAVTDKDGHAYLFFPQDIGTDTLYVMAEGSDAKTEVQILRSGDTQSAENTVSQAALTLEGTGKEYDRTQVMFILDATGSMGDEMLYLQSDFSKIAEEVYAMGDVSFSVNFYKDEGDEYVTKCNGFTDDVKQIQRALNAEIAEGGGDVPEAVAEILTETMHADDWDPDANKIAFLIFDAPPHGGGEEEIYEAIRAAAEQGIQLVPVVSSNAEFNTELFGRAVSIMTGSNYVFLTDDSGVGGSHLEPIIGSYEVELLHDVIVRNIQNVM